MFTMCPPRNDVSSCECIHIYGDQYGVRYSVCALLTRDIAACMARIDLHPPFHTRIIGPTTQRRQYKV